MTTENKEYCNQCPNHCPITDLKCPRGRRALQGEEGSESGHREHDEYKGHRGHGDHGEHGGRRGHGEHRGHGGPHPHGMAFDEDNLESLMRACGHFLYHRGQRGGGQGGILSILNKKDHISQKELQDMLRIQPGSLSEILMKLEQKGLIVREKDAQDRRKSILYLTEAGKAAIKEQRPRMEEQQLFDALNDEEKEQLKGLLKKLIASWHS